MRAPFAVLLIACALGTTAALAAPIDDAIAAAAEAKAAGDFAAMEAALGKVLALRPQHPRWSYHLAVARARQGATDGALVLLEQVAAQGAAYQPESDPDFAALAGTPRFDAIVARFSSNRAPAGAPDVAFELDDRALIPEGLACADDGVCFVSSVRRGSITRVEADGRERPFVTPRRDDLWSALGLALDQPRGLLWVASAALPELEGLKPEERGRTAVFGFALGDGRMVHRFVLADDGMPHALGDLRVLEDGRLLVSDQQGGALYLLEPRSGAYK